MRLLQLIENLNRTGQGKAAVVGWGRGMGHKGHMYLASSVITQANESDADPYFVVSRTVGKDDPITPEEKMQIYKKVFPKHGHIFHTATDEMPDLTRVLSQLDHHGYTDVTVVVGADQVKALSYVKHYNGTPDKAGKIPYSFNTLNVISRQETNDPSREEEGPRATPMRSVLTDPNASDEQKFQTWRDAMSPEISDDEVRDLMHKAQARMQDFTKPKVRAKKEKAVVEMDKSQTPPGRDGHVSHSTYGSRDKKDPDAGKKEYTAKAITAKQTTDSATGILSKAFTDSQRVDPRTGKKMVQKGVAEGLKEANAVARSLREGHGGMQKIHPHQKAAIRNATTYPQQNMSTGSSYLNYRMGIALAGAPDYPTKIEADNWIGGDPLFAPYTEEENDMLDAAAKQVGGGKRQTWSNDRSLETADTNKTSAVAKIKKNKYGI